MSTEKPYLNFLVSVVNGAGMRRATTIHIHHDETPRTLVVAAIGAAMNSMPNISPWTITVAEKGGADEF